MQLSRRYQNPIWPVVAALLGAWEFIRFMSPQHVFLNAGPWVYGSTLGVRVAFVILASLTYHMVVMLVVRQFITMVNINRIFKQEAVRVQSLHPDECGGLRFLGEHALGIAPLIAAGGLNLSLVVVEIIRGRPYLEYAPYTLPLVTVLYLVLSIAFFTAPLWSAHQSMLRARDGWLQDIGRGFELQQAVVQDEMRRGTLDAASVGKPETAKKAWDIGGRCRPGLSTWLTGEGSGARSLSPLVPIGLAVLQRILGR
jgi:hypothetical protein